MPASPLEQEAKQRFDDAKAVKVLREIDFRECYFFLAPHRLKPGRTTSQVAEKQTENDEDPQTSIGFEVGMDFATVLLNAFMPQTEKWCAREPGPDADEAEIEQITAECQKSDEKVFKAIAASNFYSEYAKSAFPDAAIGTMAIWATDPGQGRPIAFLAAPLRELYVSLGPDGRIDDRFICRATKYRHLPALLPGIDLPKEITDKVEKKGNELCDVKWGFWRKWDEKYECWQHVVLVSDKKVWDVELHGAGSCPLVVGRFNATSDSPFGYGPTMMSLPDLRQVDEIEAQKIEGIEFSIRPPLGTSGDNIDAFKDGVEPGVVIPIAPNSGPDTKQLYDRSDLNPAMYEISIKEERIRRLHFSDTPTQRGKTPPSATQWTGEIVIAQRRIGTPGLSFYEEFAVGIFERVEYLLQKRGTLQPITFNGNQIATLPVNPARRAADMQEIQNAQTLIAIGAGAFPEEWKVSVDGNATIRNVKGKLNDKIVEFRDPKDVANAIGQISQLVGGAAPGAGPPEGAQGAPPQ